MQEIHALELEVMRLKEVKAVHREFRRFVQMPRMPSRALIDPSWRDVKALPVLPSLGEKEALVHTPVLPETVQEAG